MLAGIFTLLIVMGISRFAFTPLFPLMQLDLIFSDQFAGFLASTNYFGYLLGALFAGFYNWSYSKVKFLKVFLILNILSFSMMGLMVNHIYWYFLRFIAGLTAGIIFVLISSIIMDYLAYNSLHSWSGYLYSGVGAGIFISGIIVPFLYRFLGWQGAWLGLGILSAFLATFIFRWIIDPKPYSLKSKKQDEIKINQLSPKPKITITWFTIAYAMEGMGYIISATFLVAILNKLPSFDSSSSALSWAFVGLAAAPSAILWVKFAERYGKIKMLIMAFIIQIIGIALPLILPNIWGGITGAMLFGGTFMGITALSMQIAREMYPQQSSKIIGYLTFAYGLGQIISPLIAGILTKKTGQYESSLLFACFVLSIGVLALIIGTKRAEAAAKNN